MATLRERKLKGGKTSITAQITRRNPQYQESKTFDKPKTAQAWATKREEEIDTEMRHGLSDNNLNRDTDITHGLRR